MYANSTSCRARRLIPHQGHRGTGTPGAPWSQAWEESSGHPGRHPAICHWDRTRTSSSRPSSRRHHCTHVWRPTSNSVETQARHQRCHPVSCRRPSTVDPRVGQGARAPSHHGVLTTRKPSYSPELTRQATMRVVHASSGTMQGRPAYGLITQAPESSNDNTVRPQTREIPARPAIGHTQPSAATHDPTARQQPNHSPDTRTLPGPQSSAAGTYRPMCPTAANHARSFGQQFRPSNRQVPTSDTRHKKRGHSLPKAASQHSSGQ